MNTDYIKRSAVKRLFADQHNYGLARKIDELPGADADPCTFCAYNPPSSMGGKPCSYCPATPKRRDGEN